MVSKVWGRKEGWSVKESLGERGGKVNKVWVSLRERGGMVSRVKSWGERRNGQ